MQITPMDMMGVDAPLATLSENGSVENGSIGSNSNNYDQSKEISSKESKVKRKRNRVPLSCTICRKRKVKCDKTRPHCNQCTKTGVAHLCHYMEQSWAEEAERELSKDTELKNLRERVKYLERTLSKLHSSSSKGKSTTPDNTASKSPLDSNNANGNSPFQENGSVIVGNNDQMRNNNNMNIPHGIANSNEDMRHRDSTVPNSNLTNENGLILNPKDKYDNDELDLTKQFDMLHIKNNGTIHLGATHWLAIMKGDPYLKLLWGHIFNIREKVNGWYSQRMILNKQTHKKRPLKLTGKCPIDNNNNTKILPNTVKSAMPKVPHPMSQTPTDGVMRCPVTGQTYEDLEKQPSVLPTPSKNSTAKIESDNANASNVVFKTEGNETDLPSENKDEVIPSVNQDGNKPHDKGDITEKGDDLPQSADSDATPLRCPVTGAVATSGQSAPHAIAPSESSAKHPKKDVRKRPIPYNMNPAIKHSKNPGLPSFNRLDPSHLKKVDYDSMSDKEILQRVTKLLPPRHIIFQFVNKFFKHIYPIIPIIDERNFKNHLEEILTSKVDPLTIDPSPLKIKINKPSEYCHLGIMILILRLTWLSLPANRCELKLGAFDVKSVGSPGSPSSMSTTSTSSSSANIKEDNILMSYETPAECLELVKDYLIKFDKISSISNNNINLTTIQFAVFYKMYMSNSPTEGFVVPKKNAIHSISDSNAHDNESNQILLSSIIQMAFSCGLHRDPDNFPQLNVVSTYHNKESGTTLKEATTEVPPESNDTTEGETKNKENQVATERFKHTWRKIWYYIVHLDVEQSLALGSPRLLRNMKDFSDTKLPSASKIDYVRDIKELVIIKNFTLFWQIDLVIIAVLNHILNVFLAKNVRKFELDALISSLEDLTYGKKSVSDIINDLVNKSLLYTSEASVSYQEYADDSYGLPTLEEILARENVSSPPSTVNTPSASMQEPTHITNNHINVSEKKFELPHESTTKALFFTKHLTLRMILYLLNYILFTHYEPLGSQDNGTVVLTRKYAQEALNYALDGYRNCLIFFSNVRKTSRSYSTIFDYSNVLLSPGCLDIGHRALQFIVCLTLRAKCGPIGGINQNLFTNSGGEESDVDSASEDSAPNKAVVSNLSEINPNVINDINLDGTTDAQLSENLIARMQLFEDLTRQVAVKYPYASRTSRSTGFFITLLGGHSSSKKSESSGTQWKHPNISNFFKNVPSMVLSGDNDQLSRCPVFQDALGFVSPKYSSTPGNTQLPPIKSSYKPITYTNSNIRKAEIKKEHEGEKRQKLNPEYNKAGATNNVNNNGKNFVVTNGPDSTGVNNKMTNNGVNIIPPLPIINSINNLIETMTLPNNFGLPGNMPIKDQGNGNMNNQNMPNHNNNNNGNMNQQYNGNMNGNIQIPTATLQNAYNQMVANQGLINSNSSTPLSRQQDNMMMNNGNNNGRNSMGMYPDMPNAAMLNQIAGDSGNSNLNELFDPSSVIQAISQFNPLLEINNMNGTGMPNNGMSSYNSTQNTPGSINNNNNNNMMGMMQGGGYNNMPQMGMNMNMNNSNNNNNNYNNNGGIPMGNGAVTSPYGGSVVSNNSQINSPLNNVGMNNSNTASPSMNPQMPMTGSMDMDFFMPRIEDGFTELQDFTIWD